MLKIYLKILVFSLFAVSSGTYCSAESNKTEQVKQTTIKQKCVTVLKHMAHFAGTSFFKSVKLASLLMEGISLFELSYSIPIEGLIGATSEDAAIRAFIMIPIYVVSSKIEAILEKLQP